VVTAVTSGGTVVVPTPVGVNRYGRRSRRDRGGCPHTRGGEPLPKLPKLLRLLVVPTPVGVNRAICY